MPNTFLKIHFLFYVMALLSALTGYFKEFLTFMLFIFVHELGHIFIALLLKWKIAKVLVLPLGAITFFDEKINRPIKEEFWIAIGGIIFQTIFYKFLSFLNAPSFCTQIHSFLLFFNLLPIYPLDGAKLVNLFLNKCFSFSRSYKLSFFISFFALFLLLILYRSNLILACGFFLLLFQLYCEVKNYPFTYNKFLFERYVYHFPFYKTKKIKGENLKQMKRDYRHLFILENKTLSERQLLEKWFDKNV